MGGGSLRRPSERGRGEGGRYGKKLFCRLGTLGISCHRPSPAPGRADGRRRRRGLRRRSGRYLTPRRRFSLELALTGAKPLRGELRLKRSAGASR